MTKNEIVARFIGAVPAKNWQGKDGWQHADYSHFQWSNRFQNEIETDVYTKYELKYDSDYNWLMSAWVKFRDLNFEDEAIEWSHSIKCRKIADKLAWSTITEAFDELVKGIEWYNSLNK